MSENVKFQLGRRDPEGELIIALAARIVRNRTPVREEIEQVAKSLHIQTPVDQIIKHAERQASFVSKSLPKDASDSEITNALVQKRREEPLPKNWTGC
jgi:hypothetical protein